MTDATTFSCEYRKRTGTGGARAVRRDGWVPATLYGGNVAPANIKLKYNEVLKALNTGRLISVLSKIDIDGKEHSVIGRDVQLDPVKDLPLHVDMMRVSAKTRLKVDVPMSFLNQDICPGLKGGGVLNVVRHTVEVIAPATAIPEALEADLATVEAGETVHVSAVPLPDGVELTITDRDFTVATITAPSGSQSDDDDAATSEGDPDGEAEAAGDDGDDAA